MAKKSKASKKNAAAQPDVDGDDTTEPAAGVVETTAVDSSDNEFSVPQDQWDKWDDRQRDLFNTLYSAMMRSPSLFNSHPEAPTIQPDQWRTIAWNAAWQAACV